MAALSVVTVTLNDSSGLLKTAHSLQNYRTVVEWIVIDGGSNYDVPHLLRQQQPDVLISESDRGVYDAMNKGALSATSPFLLFLNGGDRIVSSLVAKSAILGLYGVPPKSVMLGTADYVFPSRGTRRRRAYPAAYLHHGLPAIHQAIIYPRGLWEETQYDLSYEVAADYALTAWAWRNGYSFLGLDCTLAEFSAGGWSYQAHQKLNLEASRVQRDILGTPRAVRLMSSLLRGINRRRLTRSLGRA